MPDIRTRAELTHAAKVALRAVHPADLTVVELTALVNLAESLVQVRRPVDEVGNVIYIAHDRITVTGHEASDPLGSRCHGIAVAAAYSAFPAHADQNGYLKALADGGWTTEYPDELLRTGYIICKTLYQGYPDQHVVSELAADHPDIPPRGAQVMVAAAHSQLCPDVAG